jgi:hypothetical protein
MLPITLLSLVGLAAAGPISAFDFTTTAAPTVGVTVEDLNKFRIYAEWSAAAYCNSQSAPGSPIRCGGSCPTLEGDVATIVQPLKYGAVLLDPLAFRTRHLLTSQQGRPHRYCWLRWCRPCPPGNCPCRPWQQQYPQLAYQHPFRLQVVRPCCRMPGPRRLRRCLERDLPPGQVCRRLCPGRQPRLPPDHLRPLAGRRRRHSWCRLPPP